MPLGPGVRLGSYEIVALIGAAVWGEVYRAHDDRLNRDVAIKTLPAAFAVDPDRLMRFKREAQLLASLNHTNIAATGARFSRDGKWVAYSERGSDKSRVYVEAFPPTGGQKHELPVSGASISAHKIGWSATTAELFYVPRIFEFEAVPFTTRPTFKFGDARKVPRPFGGPGAPNMRTQYDITPQGKFVGLFPPGDTAAPPPVNQISVIVNWVEEMKARR